MFGRFDEIPSLPVENIKEKPKHRGWMDGLTDGQRENSIPPTNTVCRVAINIYVLYNELKQRGLEIELAQVRLCVAVFS